MTAVTASAGHQPMKSLHFAHHVNRWPYLATRLNDSRKKLVIIMSCISLSSPTLAVAETALESHEGLAEVRIDLLRTNGFSDDDLRAVFRCRPLMRKISTCRAVGDGGDGFGAERMRLLKLGMEEGAAYVDVEIEAPAAYIADIVAFAAARSPACVVVVSYHNYEATPSAAELREIVDRCFALGAGVAKVAVKAETTRDVARVLALYDDERVVVALAMGAVGVISRVAAPLLGAPFTFVAASAAEATAPGQLTSKQMARTLEAMQ